MRSARSWLSGFYFGHVFVFLILLLIQFLSETGSNHFQSGGKGSPVLVGGRGDAQVVRENGIRPSLPCRWKTELVPLKCL